MSINIFVDFHQELKHGLRVCNGCIKLLIVESPASHAPSGSVGDEVEGDKKLLKVLRVPREMSSNYLENNLCFLIVYSNYLFGFLQLTIMKIGPLDDRARFPEFTVVRSAAMDSFGADVADLVRSASIHLVDGLSIRLEFNLAMKLTERGLIHLPESRT